VTNAHGEEVKRLCVDAVDVDTLTGLPQAFDTEPLPIQLTLPLAA
jgi:hypothetical protein